MIASGPTVAVQVLIGSNGAYHWAGDNSGFAVPLLAAFAASQLSVQLNDLFQWLRRKPGVMDFAA